ncbi:MAG: YdcH family protein [Reyranellaceae bacterium]
MATVDRVETLKAKHAALEAALQEENTRPHPDETAIAALKRQKLKLKDTIKVLARQ